MNILVLEDDPIAFNIIEYLTVRGYNVYHAQSLLDVAYYLKETPGLEFFDKLMFDVAVPKEKFSVFNNEEIEYGKKYGFSGFEFVSKNYQYISHKEIALITAYKVTLFDKVKDMKDKDVLENLTIIDKGSDDFIMDLLSFLNG
ncbi:MAG: response regulator transcription factor [Clostridia bacterium]|nr:response regulator transcription factor [Clostridia bacterium]